MILPNHDRYRDYTDEELEAFLKAFPDHVDQPRVRRERELRQSKKSEVAANDRTQGQYRVDEDGRKPTQTQGESSWLWAKVGGIAAIIGIIAVVLGGMRLSSCRRTTTTTTSTPASATTSPRTVPDDVLSMPSPKEEPQLAELLASPTPSPKAAPE